MQEVKDDRRYAKEYNKILALCEAEKYTEVKENEKERLKAEKVYREHVVGYYS